MIKIFISVQESHLVREHVGLCVIIYNDERRFSKIQSIVYNNKGYTAANPANGIKHEYVYGEIDRVWHGEVT